MAVETLSVDALLHDTTFWVAVSFIIFIVAVFGKAKNAILTMLDDQIEKIKEEIATAESLREEAKELLAQYRRKKEDVLKDTEAALDSAKKQSIDLQKQTEDETKQIITLRERQLEERISRIEEKAVADIRTYASEIASEATLKIVLEKLSKAENDKLVDNTIKQLPETIKKAS